MKKYLFLVLLLAGCRSELQPVSARWLRVERTCEIAESIQGSDNQGDHIEAWEAAWEATEDSFPEGNYFVGTAGYCYPGYDSYCPWFGDKVIYKERKRR